jgi:predicted dehydrogenase
VAGTDTQDGLREGGFLPEFEAFVTAVAIGNWDAVQSGAEESYRTMVIYDACVESAKTGKQVELSYSEI